MDRLNVDAGLYAVSVNAATATLPSAEAAAAAEAFAAEFERDGAGGTPTAALRGRVRALEAELAGLGEELATPVLVAQGTRDVDAAVRRLGPSASLCVRSPEGLWATTERAAVAVQGLNADMGIATRLARRRDDIVDLIERLARDRRDLAISTGASSFASMTLQGPPPSVAQDERTVAAFIEAAATALRPLARAQALGRAAEGFEAELDAATCVDALIEVAALLGISARRTQCQPGEAWHDTVERLDVFDGARRLGVVYLDLRSRPGKVDGAALFTVRCGCAVDEPLSADDLPLDAPVWGLEDGGFRQLAAVALVCSFAGDRLSHGDLETLLHEFGHALHSVLSTTTCQHLSGTRGAADVVELASTFLERFAWTLEAAKTPNRPRVLAARAATNAVDQLHQLGLAAFDQALHGNRAFRRAASTGDDDAPPRFGDAADIANNLAASVSPADCLRLPHIATAPATYYAPTPRFACVLSGFARPRVGSSWMEPTLGLPLRPRPHAPCRRPPHRRRRGVRATAVRSALRAAITRSGLAQHLPRGRRHEPSRGTPRRGPAAPRSHRPCRCLVRRSGLRTHNTRSVTIGGGGATKSGRARLSNRAQRSGGGLGDGAGPRGRARPRRGCSA